MTATLALRQTTEPAPATLPATPELAWLMAHVQTNRFLPHPPPDSIFVGDGDYRAIGAEFLGHFVRIGRLQPHERVFDIGCGIGRMAVPLTQYLDPERGSYDGVDPVMDGILWCAQTITPAYPRFRFQRLDIAHPLYNPQGSLPGNEVRFGFANQSFDFITMTSVATHLPPDELVVYLNEAARLLAPGGRLFLTAFALDGQSTGQERLKFRRWGEGPGWYAIEEAPLAAAGIDAGFLLEHATQAGLAVERLDPGHWRGHSAAHYQDLLLAVKPGGQQ
ncbi:MAG: class I SAM-dependent methyltransferase [Bosea sp.]|uniref:class I SAM-dependent methyltransferase n=1 Tax=Bosea sp. (in: a-proteobacteria) TaxID=1871050 RepID=UPI002382B3D2|nr:class I SAM-dependent methyltransferase [Bosea sp. (in: a-proteobacteria)]MCP4732791.1 class I SAM-dependent methyltransferase [Bosea sp. (in: a-proteobacteria)]